MCNVTKQTCERAPEVLRDVAHTEPKPSSSLTWVGWTGIALTTGGAGLLTMAFLKDADVADQVEVYDGFVQRNELSAATAQRQEIQDTQSQGQLFLYAGAGLAGLGLGLLIYDLVAPSESPVSAVPQLTADGAGISAIGRF